MFCGSNVLFDAFQTGQTNAIKAHLNIFCRIFPLIFIKTMTTICFEILRVTKIQIEWFSYQNIINLA